FSPDHVPVCGSKRFTYTAYIQSLPLRSTRLEYATYTRPCASTVVAEPRVHPALVEIPVAVAEPAKPTQFCPSSANERVVVAPSASLAVTITWPAPPVGVMARGPV